MKNKISIRFFCGHFEAKTTAEIKREKIVINFCYPINGQQKTESGQYCFVCSNLFK